MGETAFVVKGATCAPLAAKAAGGSKHAFRVSRDGKHLVDLRTKTAADGDAWVKAIAAEAPPTAGMT